MLAMLLAGVLTADGVPASPETATLARIRAAPDVAPPPRLVDPLPPGALARMGSPRFRHPRWAHTLVFTPDGRKLVSAGSGALVVWDARTGEALRFIGSPHGEMADGTAGVMAAYPLAGGSALLVNEMRSVDGRPRNRFYVWDVGGDAEAREISITRDPAHTKSFGPNAVAPDGSTMAEKDSATRSIWLWDRAGHPTGRLADAVDKFDFNDLSSEPKVFAPDGKTLYVGRKDGSVDVWDVAGRKRVRRFPTGAGRREALAVSADGRRLVTFDQVPAAGEADRSVPGAVRVWDVADGRAAAALPWEGAASAVNHALLAGFLPDGRLWAAAATISPDALVFRMWNRDTRRPLHDWTVQRLAAWAVTAVVSPDGSRVAVGTMAGPVLLFDTATGAELSPGGHRDMIERLRFTPDGERLVSQSGDRTVRTWDAASGRPLTVIDADGLLVGLSPDGRVVYDATHRPKAPYNAGWTLSARETATGRTLWRLADLCEVEPYPHGRRLLAKNRDDPRVQVLDAATGRPIDSTSAFPRAYRADGRTAVYVNRSAVTVWDLDAKAALSTWDAREVGLLRSGRPAGGKEDYRDWITAVAASPCGKYLAVGVTRGAPFDGHQSALSVCESTGGRVVWRAKDVGGYGPAPAFSPDGKTLAVAGPTAKLFDAATGKELADFDARPGPVVEVAFSPDGTRLATGGRGGLMYVWRVPRK